MSPPIARSGAGAVVSLNGSCASTSLPESFAPSQSRMREHKSIDKAALVIVGCVRNGAKTVRSTVQTLVRASAAFASVRFLIVESDSIDATVSELQRMRNEISGLEFTSLGRLAERFPERTERIALCRNRYLDELRNDPRYVTADYVMVVDLDGVNDDLRAEAVASCWVSHVPWDVVAANQRDAYYDIGALRHADWCPVDCHHQYSQLRSLFGHPRALALAMHSRMVRLSPEADWIEVDSAFGGLAIYRREALLAGRYRGVVEGRPICEQVPLHAELRSRGYRIFINPALINAHRTDHSARIGLSVRLRRKIEAIGMRMRSRQRG